MKKILSALISAVLMMAISLQGITTDAAEKSVLKVSMIDVGQADSVLIQNNGKAMLIDAGNAADQGTIESYLEKNNVKHLEYLVLTHPHEDHIGSAEAIEKDLKPEITIMTDTAADSKTYESLLSELINGKHKIIKAMPGAEYNLGKAIFKIVGPIKLAYSDINDTSVVVMLSYGSTGFLFMGDAERKSETDIMAKGYDLKADLLKVGHHGSEYSTGETFLKKVNPKYAFVSVGKENVYGHPAAETMQLLEKYNIKVYRTDKLGSVIAISDGKTISIDKSPVTINGPPVVSESNETYIGNKNTKKFHRYTCKYLPIQKNRINFTNRNIAIKAGYEPCKVCKP